MGWMVGKALAAELIAGGAELLTVFVLRDRQLDALPRSSPYPNKPDAQVEP